MCNLYIQLCVLVCGIRATIRISSLISFHNKGGKWTTTVIDKFVAFRHIKMWNKWETCARLLKAMIWSDTYLPVLWEHLMRKPLSSLMSSCGNMWKSGNICALIYGVGFYAPDWTNLNTSSFYGLKRRCLEIN